MRLFNRIVSLQIGPRGEEGVELSAFRVSFEVSKDDRGKPANSATLVVYNLSHDTTSQIKQGDRIVLGAGHDGIARTIFIGDVTKIEGSRSSVKIEADDGALSISNVNIAKTYDAGTPAGDMIADIAESMGFDGVNISDVEDTLSAGFAAIGPAADAISSLSDRFGLTWTVQDYELHVTPKGEPISTDMFLLTYETGLLDVPQRITQENYRTVTTKPMYSVRSRLIGHLNPGRLVQVECPTLNGVFRIQKVKHTGDSRGQSFYSDLEVIER